MRSIWLCVIAWAFFCFTADAQVPETGRWQELTFSTEEVHSRVASDYDEILANLSIQHQLDDVPAIAERVQRIAATIIHAAISLQPRAANWHWEIHTTSNPDIEAFCMAGGKLLVGSEFVRRLDLSDGELATLIGHEVAHAIAEHNRETLSEALYINPLPATSLDVLMARLDTDLSLQIGLSRLSNMQESEADQLGMTIANQAGWPTSAMVSFYQKLLDTETPSAISSSHPAAFSRLSMAKGLALLFHK